MLVLYRHCLTYNGLIIEFLGDSSRGTTLLVGFLNSDITSSAGSHLFDLILLLPPIGKSVGSISRGLGTQ